MTQQTTKTQTMQTAQTETEMTEEKYRQYAQDVIKHKLGIHLMPKTEFERKQRMMKRFEEQRA